MSFIPFTVTGSGSFASQPQGAGEKIIIVSNDATDNGETLTVSGLVGGLPDSEVITLGSSGLLEVEGTKSFTSLSSVVASAGVAGSISAYGQGTAGVGDSTVSSVPATGATWVIGLNGLTRTYTFRGPAAFTITTVAAASLAASDYFRIAVGATTYDFWFQKDGAGSAPGLGGTETMVVIVTGNTAGVIATALEAAMESAIAGFTCSVSSDVVTCVKDVLGNVTLTFTDGIDAAATGFTYTEISEGTADAANQIRTGYDTDGTAATTSDIALWIQYAINASVGTAGTHYGTGTAVHAQLSASASSSIVTLTDRIATARDLGWTKTDPTGLSTRLPLGGLYGALIAALAASQSINVAQSFDNADLSDATLIAGFTGNTDGILLNGQPATLRIACANIASAITVAVQGSDDGVAYNTISGATALTGTASGTAGAYAITGAGTAFDTELRVGSVIVISTNAYEVASIASSTSLAVRTPLITSPSGTAAAVQLPVQLSSIDNNSQYIPLPQREYVRLDFLTNGTTVDSNFHAGIIL
jgi:hypothetical protein